MTKNKNSTTATPNRDTDKVWADNPSSPITGDCTGISDDCSDLRAMIMRIIDAGNDACRALRASGNADQMETGKNLSGVIADILRKIT